MNAQWDWVVKNREWIFSGIGLTVLAVVWWVIRKLFGRNNSKPPSGINITLSPTISPTISPNQSNIQNTNQPKEESARELVPDIKAVTYKAAFAKGIGTGKSCFIVSFRNDGWADATNVIAHIGYSCKSSGQKFLVDYGGWIEPMPIMNIPRGHTKNLIIAVTENGKNFAVTDISPATNYTDFRLVEVGEITPGDWEMLVTLSADNFRRDYVFDLTVVPDASVMCNPR